MPAAEADKTEGVIGPAVVVWVATAGLFVFLI
jgi:hypothetical protein